VRFFLSDIYPAIRRINDRVRFYVVGGHVPEQLTTLAARDASIVITGEVDDPVPYIQRAAVFIAPILSGGGTKLKVLEAMAAGKAIVSTSVGVEGIDGQHGQHFLVADQPERFADCVSQLLQDRQLRERLGVQARRTAEERYDWRVICAKMSSLYQTAAASVPQGDVAHPAAVHA
jgi:glycosyltransferase involved in cell wall biosynthesis